MPLVKMPLELNFFCLNRNFFITRAAYVYFYKSCLTALRLFSFQKKCIITASLPCRNYKRFSVSTPFYAFISSHQRSLPATLHNDEHQTTNAINDD